MPDWTTHACAASARRALDRWHLRDPQTVATTRTSLVLRVTRQDGSAAILKCLTTIGAQAEAHAATALQAWDGRGAVTLYAAVENALLLEFCDGPTLHAAARGERDAMAIPVLCDVVNRLHANVSLAPQTIPTLADRCAVLTQNLAWGHADQALLDTAAVLARHPIDTTSRDTLLHGDFHHENVLRTQPDTWRAIDPQPLRGDRAYDFANLFCNPIDDPDLVLAADRLQRLAHEIAQRSDLCPSRLLRWAFVHACISAAWHMQDGRDPAFRLAVARNLTPHIGPTAP